MKRSNICTTALEGLRVQHAIVQAKSTAESAQFLFCKIAAALKIVLTMTSLADEEECFKMYLEYEPKLRIHFFLINSLYNQTCNGILDCADVARQMKISVSDIHTAIDYINQCSPDMVIIKNNPNYFGVTVTELGKSVLQYDISKLVTLEEIWPGQLEAICPSDVIMECVHNNWLYRNRSSKFKRYERGKNYCDFVTLYTSLRKFTETNNLTNQKHLLDAKLITVVKERLEISRGLMFPLAKHEKLILLYKLAESLYRQSFEVARNTFNEIKREKYNIGIEQTKLNNKIKVHNPSCMSAIDQHQNLMIIHGKANNSLDLFTVPPQPPPIVVPTLKLQFKQLQQISFLAPPRPLLQQQQLPYPYHHRDQCESQFLQLQFHRDSPQQQQPRSPQL